MTTTLLPALLGLATGLSLIIAIGAQNAYVLRIGIEGRLRIVAAVVLVCALSDAVLILAGVLGIGALVQAAPVALVAIRVIGSAFLIGYGLLAARRAIRPAALAPGAGTRDRPFRAAVATAVALTWLNPHVYLDTILFLGSVANQQGPDERWWWAGGALAASCLWFAGLGFGARLLRPVFARPGAWRVLDAVIACVMVGLGLRLAFGL
ncbi:L-lysine exporter family protein LysE/ArgO [Frondihabitans sp. PhB188]|uniref:LysE/ArgO family amino acid transporter n=1 Tax=Frondihabitans sp. PhB188 TaxID=2485200 RepID=UPI000F470445|nr:LysE family transporter [Frondihabitans sp. PhB188]ROQ37372.1 L-lysine exporter family protein LysE/ArgO [Frondihabitans sp. PhB188]